MHDLNRTPNYLFSIWSGNKHTNEELADYQNIPGVLIQNTSFAPGHFHPQTNSYLLCYTSLHEVWHS